MTKNERIAALEARIEQLETRIQMLEARPVYPWWPTVPQEPLRWWWEDNGTGGPVMPPTQWTFTQSMDRSEG